MKKKTVFLLAFAVALILATTLPNAFAYFYTYARAAGGYTIQLGDKTTITEPKVENWTKHIVVESEPDSQPVYVRVKAFAGNKYSLTYGCGKDTEGNPYWKKKEKDDGYFYYTGILQGGQSTEEMWVKIENIPTGAKEGDSFNVVVIYETTPVIYDENGQPHADWDVVLNSGSTGSGSGEGGSD